VTFSIRIDREILLPWPLEKLNNNRSLLMKILLEVFNLRNIKKKRANDSKVFVFLALVLMLMPMPSENELL